jgi:hypothetical protein
MYRWAEYARREPLWAPPGDGAGGSRRLRPGRPSRLNSEVVGRYLMAIRAGNFREPAARFAGIGPATMYRWMRDPRPEYAAFRMALLQCEAEVEVEVIGNLMRLSRTCTRAGRFLLERRWPERWGPRRPLQPAEETRETRPGLSETVRLDEERFPEIAARLYAQTEAIRASVEKVLRVG